MIYLLLNSIALDPNRWTPEKTAYYKFDQLLKPIVEADFHFVEIWGYHILRENEKTITSFREIGDSLGLQFPIIGMYPKLHLNGNERQQEMDQVKKIFNDANILGTQIVKIFVGNLSTETITTAEYGRSVEFMSEMANIAKSFGLIIVGETHPKTLFDNIDSTKQLLNDVNATNFRICFQPYNFYDTNQAIRDYKVLADEVIHVHYQGRKDDKMDLLENSDIDYEVLTKLLIESGFGGHISIEFVKDCVVKKSEDFDLHLVLTNAERDRDFIAEIGKKYESQVLL
jgi:sugar phosphate isomerase/epimerase